ncbi:MAG: putative glycoside hydrolase, partial [Patescibacteria group bacterium]
MVGTHTFRDSLVSLVEKTDLNALVIDIKDFTGTIAFPTEHPLLKDAAMVECGAHDMKEFLRVLHEKGIFVIGRITVFQDPFYTKRHPELAVQSIGRPGQPWKDRKGLSFVDVSSRPFWEYIVALSR